MGGSNQTAAETAQTQMDLSGQMYGLSKQASSAGQSYLTGAYGMGGYDQSDKFRAMQSQAIDRAGGMSGSFLNPQSMAGMAGAKAEAISQVGSQKLLSGLDQMNQLRSQLAGQGLATTNFAQQSGAMSSRALGGMAANPTMSTINAGLGLASSIYGGFNQMSPGTPSSGQPTGQWGSFLGSQYGPGMTSSTPSTYGSAIGFTK